MEHLNPSFFDAARGRRGILAIVLCFLAVNLVGLDRSPVVWIDEVAMNDPAKELALHGKYRSSVFAGQHHFEEVYLWVPPGQPLVIAASYALAGFGIWQTRIPPLLFGAALLLLVYAIARILARGDIRPALIAALLVSLDPQFLQTARAGRMDTQCIFFALLAFWFLLRAGERGDAKLLPNVYAGLSVSAALITSPVSAPWALSIGLLTLIESRNRRILRTLVYGCAAASLFLLWIVYALRTPEAFHEQFFALVGDHVPALTIPRRIVEEFIRYWRVYKTAPLLILLFAASLAWLFTKACDRKTRLRLLLFFGVAFLFNMFFMGKLGGYYSLHPNVILLMGAGLMLFHFWNVAQRNRLLLRLAYGSALLLLALNLLASGVGGRLVTLAYQWEARDYSRVTEALGRKIPPGSVVWGTEGIWYAVEKNGSTLRLLGAPDPLRHDFLVLRKDQDYPVPQGFQFVAETGEPLPPLFGRVQVTSFDYRLRIYRSAMRRSRAESLRFAGEAVR